MLLLSIVISAVLILFFVSLTLREVVLFARWLRELKNAGDNFESRMRHKLPSMKEPAAGRAPSPAASGIVP